MIYGTVLSLGDSLTFGARCYLGFPEYLARDLTLRHDRRIEWSAINAGVCGETTRQILDRTPALVQRFAALPGPKVITYLAGTNDSKGNGTRPLEWQEAYRQTVRWLRRVHGARIVLCTIPALQSDQMPCYTEGSMRWIERANYAIRDMHDVLNSRSINLVDLADIHETVDGVHLTPEASETVAGRITEVIAPRESA